MFPERAHDVSVLTLPAIGNRLRVAVINEAEGVVVRSAVEWLESGIVDTISATNVSL
jgi:hypothetical protein